MNPLAKLRTGGAAVFSIALTTFLSAGPPAAPSPPPATVPKKPPAAPPMAPGSRCAPITSEVIPADKVLADLRDGKSVNLQGKIVEGSLDVDTVFPEADTRRTTLRNIKGGLKLDACRVTGRVALRHCVFTEDVALGCTEILGDLDLSDSELRGALKAERARVSGDVLLNNATVDGDVFLKSATLQGSLDLNGARLHRVFAMSMDLGGLTAEHVLLHLIDLTGAKARTVRLADVMALDSITARDATFSRGLSFNGVRVGGTIQLGGASISGEFALSDVSMDEDLFLPQLFDGPTSVADVAVGRNLVLDTGELQDVTIERLKVGVSTRMEGNHFAGKVVIAESQFGKTFKANQTVFADDCEFRSVIFPGEDPLAGVEFVRKPVLVDTKLLHDPTGKPRPAGDTGSETPDDSSGP